MARIISLVLFLSLFMISGCQTKIKNSQGQDIIPVKAMKVELKDLNYILEYAGDIKAEDEAYIYPKVSGKIIEKLKEDGSIVNKGDYLCYIDRDEVGLNFKKAPVESTLSGVVGRFLVDIGENVTAQTPIAFVVNDSKVKIILDIPEKYLPKLFLGQEARFRVDAWPGQEFSGIVSKISPVINLATRSSSVEISADNPNRKLRSGMFARVSIILDKRESVPAIIKEAIMGRDSNSYVFVIENNKAKLKQISLGIRDGFYYEASSGLTKGDIVVIMGQQKLFEGASVEFEVEKNMNLPQFGVKKPVTNLMIFLAMVILAIYSLSRLGVDMMPEIEPPSISVVSSYPGASPADVEIKVTEELENQLGTTPGLEKITSTSSEGTSIIRLKFIWGTNLDEASNDIRDRIDRAKRFLPDIPEEMDNPMIFKFNTANIPIIYIGVTADQSYPDLYDIVDKRVGDVLKQIPGVGTVQIQGGGLERQINIWVDRQQLEGYGFSILDIKNKLKYENITQPVGNLKTGLTDYLIRLPGEFANPEDINLLILGKRNNKLIYLKDVARIEDSFKEETGYVRINKKRGIMLMVQKQTGTNTVEVAGRVKEKLKEIETVLPADVKLNIIFDTSQNIIESLDSLKSSVWVGIVLVILVVWFFLRAFTPSLIIALTLPFSLLAAFIYLFLSKGTINVISLSSLAIATGMIVDNAIVVVDNVHRKIERGNRPSEAAIFGASELFLAIGASTLTTLVVFLPMLFIPGVIGIMFGVLAMVVSVTLIASLFTALTFTPMLCSKFLRIKERKPGYLSKLYQASEKLFVSWENLYGKTLGFCLNHKKLVLIGFIGAFIFSLMLLPLVGSEFIPEEDSGDIRLTVYLPIGTRVEETDKVAQRIEEILKADIPEAKFYYSRSGTMTGVGRLMGGASGTHIISAGAKLIPKEERKRSSKEIGQIVRGKIKAIPGVLKTDITTGSPLGRMIAGTGGKRVQLDITGHSFEETDALAEKIRGVLEKIPGAVDVSVSREANRPELRIEVDREKASSLGLDMHTVSETLKAYIQGSTATKYREKGKTYDIYVRLEESSRSKLEDLDNLFILPPLPEENAPFARVEAATYSAKYNLRKLVRLSNIAKIYETTGPETIERQNRERVVSVECNTYMRSPGKIVEDLKKELSKIVIPSDIIVSFGGEVEEQHKAFKDLTLLLILGIALVYMVMAGQFESLLDPFIVMFSIPFTFVGVILGFVLTRTYLSINTFLGIIMLMGIVVNNAIVLISYINILRARGFSMYDAVTSAGKDRLRPVLMTTITTLVGLLPLALSRGSGSETWQPLGITMISGLSVATFVTMFLVPTLYAVFHRKKALKKEGVS